MEISYVPTSSMETTIKAGSFIVVSKMHYGPRIPSATFSIFNDCRYIKFPGFSSVGRNDMLMFDSIYETNTKYLFKHNRQKYIKRCIGLPGDRIKMEDNNITINGQAYPTLDTVLMKYKIITKFVLSQQWLQDNGIGFYDMLSDNECYVYVTTKCVKAISNKRNCIIESCYSTTKTNFLENFDSSNTISNFSEILVPYKGLKLHSKNDNILAYKETIMSENNQVTFVGNELIINGKQISEYEFRQNYYFVLGDNRYNSIDSRYTGFIPEDNIIGKVIYSIP